MDHYIKLFKSTANKYLNYCALRNYGGKYYTYGEVLSHIEKIHRIFHEIGVQKGDHIAICARNSAEWAITFLSITSYHAVAVPLLYEFTTSDIEALTNHSDSIILFTEEKIYNSIDCSRIQAIKAIIEIESEKILYSTCWEKNDNVISEEFNDPNELTIINYTSGTTGKPKGVMLTAGNISSNINFGLDRIPVYHGDKIVSMLPLAHMYSLAFEFLYPLIGGAEITFLGKTPSPNILLKALRETKPYILITVPLVLEKIFKTKIIPRLNGPIGHIPIIKHIQYRIIHKKLMKSFGGKIRTIVIGGAAISERVEKAMKKIRIPYTIGYGMTECGPLLGYEDWREFRAGSCGKPVTGMDIRIDSYDSINIAGEIQAKGVNVTLGYYKNEEATKNLFTDDGWMHTGDLGIIDYQNNIFIKGRSKCMILTSNGQNIYPEEIEEKINNLTWVSESIVVQRNKSLVALISLKDEFRHYNRIKGLIELTKKEVNKALPLYSQISKIELKEKFEHTPKHSIKRFLYS